MFFLSTLVKMKKLFIIFLCITYTFVALGGSIFVHNCDDNSVFSIYEKATHDECPICSKKGKTKKICGKGSCKDTEIKINQLSDELFSANNAEKFLIQPFIFERLWVETTPISRTIQSQSFSSPILLYCSSSDPPNYLLNCNFRI